VFDPAQHKAHWETCGSRKKSAVIILDTETTGLDPTFNEIVQLAAIAVEPGTMRILDKFEVNIKPRYPERYTSRALQVTGLTLDYLNTTGVMDLHAAETFKEWQQKFYRPVMCAYNLKFDEGFIKTFCPGLEWANHQMDVMHVAMGLLWLPGRIKSYKLEVVAGHLGYEFQAHNAMADVLATFEILRRLIGRIG
jgi:DNA polymerase-3 subunit epsilon